MYSYKYFMEKREDMGARAFNQEYLGNPVDEESSNFTAVSNDLKPVLFANPAVGYAEIAVYLYLAMHVQVSEDAGKGTPNGKQGYAYTTKARMQGELAIGKTKLNRSLDVLEAEGLIKAREVANKYGGKPLKEYRLSDEWKGAFADRSTI